MKTAMALSPLQWLHRSISVNQFYTEKAWQRPQYNDF
jgi:hypothetical protein